MSASERAREWTIESSLSRHHIFLQAQLVLHLISNETLGEAIYLFICYDVPNAADGWNRSLHSFFFLLLSLSPSLFPFVSVSPLSIYASPLLVLKKLWHVRIYDEETEKKKRAANHYHRHHPVFVQWFPRSLSRCSPRTNVEAHIKLIRHILTRCACPSSVRMYIYTRIFWGKKKVIFVYIQYVHRSIFLNTQSVILLRVQWNKRSLPEFNCINPFLL